VYQLFLSFRFIWRHRLMTLIGSFFVAASLVVLIVVMAVMDGFQAKLKDTFAGSEADLIVTPRDPGIELDLLAVAIKKRLGDRVVASGPHYETISMVRREGQVDPSVMDEFQVAQVFGVDGRLEQRVNNFGEYLHKVPDRTEPTVLDVDEPFKVHDINQASFGRIGVILGHRLARSLHVIPGQRIKLFALVSKDSAGNGGGNPDLADYQLRQELFLVVGLYQSGNSEIDRNCVFMDHKDFGTFFDERTARGSLRSKLADPDDDFDAAREALVEDWWAIVNESLPEGRQPAPWLRDESARAAYAFSVLPWSANHQAMVRAIESEKAMILVIAFLIVIAGTSSIFAAQWLLVSDKVREIGILRALGADVRGVATIFVLNGFLMGVLGSLGGTGGGLLFVRYIDQVHQFISWVTGRDIFDPDIYLFTEIPTRVDPEQVLQFSFAALICTLIAAAIPALRAGFMDPARALHHE
jgi:lipoprotein-releasing system permease protein